MKILVVEDEPKMARLVQRGLTEEGHQVDTCATGESALVQAQRVEYEVIVLDWGLPDLDGVAVVRQWRERGLATPVLMLTARGSTGEKVVGLRAGADDYLVKPFDFEELLARLEALRRRSLGASAPTLLADVQVDPRRRALRRGEREVVLTGREFALFEELSQNLGDAVSRSRLLTKVWGSDFEGTGNVVDVYIGYLRAKLERIGADALVLEAVRGIGYRLVAT